MYLRRSLQESVELDEKNTKQIQTAGTLKALVQHPKAVLTVIGLTVGGTVAFYTFTTYMQKFLVNTSGFSKNSATLISTLTLVVFMLLQPLFGFIIRQNWPQAVVNWFRYTGHINYRTIMTALSNTKDVWVAFALIMCALIIVSGYTSINAVVKAELFPANVRALGVGFPYAIAVSLFGGTAEYIALVFKNNHHQEWFYWYVTICMCFRSFYITMNDTRKYSKIE